MGTAAVVLLAGAGCQADVQQEASLETGTETQEETQDDGRTGIDAEASLEASVDVAADAILTEAEADAMVEYEEGNDADVVGNDGAELDAYGKAYVQSEL